MADYEVLESKMTKVFKVVDAVANVNESNQHKEGFQEAPAAVVEKAITK